MMCFINLQISTCICTLNKRPCNQSYWAKLSQTTQPCLTVSSQYQFNNRTRFCLFICCFSTLFDVIFLFYPRDADTTSPHLVISIQFLEDVILIVPFPFADHCINHH